MQNNTTLTLLDLLENCRMSKYSGLVTLNAANSRISIWFVRGSLTHAESDSGESGWKALESVRTSEASAIVKRPGELPPERTIRVETAKLISAMKSFPGAKPVHAMRVPVPFHTRMQRRFAELQQRVIGLQSFETARRSDLDSLDSSAIAGIGPQTRTIIEKGPRGSCWTYCFGKEQLVIKGDETVSTTELMWAGSELQKELDHLRKSVF